MITPEPSFPIDVDFEPDVPIRSGNTPDGSQIVEPLPIKDL
jgi:hypothetical protein